MGTRLKDYFPAEAIRLLKWFCTTSNHSDRSSHPSDQRKWIAFLQCVYRTQTEVDGDTFGACLKAKGWWPEEHIPTLVDEYELAMRLLGQHKERSACDRAGSYFSTTTIWLITKPDCSKQQNARHDSHLRFRFLLFL
jgi:hypothetical protein